MKLNSEKELARYVKSNSIRVPNPNSLKIPSRAKREGTDVTNKVYITDLGVYVNPAKFYVMADSGVMRGGVSNEFDSEEAATQWANTQPNIDLGDVDQIVQGSAIIAAYSSDDGIDHMLESTVNKSLT